LPFVPGDQTDSIRAHIREVSKLQGESALDISIQDVMNQTEAILKSLPEMVTATGVDALVLDTGQFYAELGPMQLAMPYIQVSNMLTLRLLRLHPLCLFSWPHETTPAALARNRECVARIAEMLAPASTGIRLGRRGQDLKSTGKISPPLFLH
jgi:hypothetical protein